MENYQLNAADKLNIIRKTATNAYQNTVPMATMDNIRDVGQSVLTAPPNVFNEFYDAILNIIGMVIINSAEFTNPLTSLKKGKMEYGMTIEDIFVEIPDALQYVAGTRDGETPPDQYEIIKAKLKAAFYSTEYERQYGVTMHQEDVKRAFRSADPVGTLTSSVMQSLRTREELDDYRMTVALLARQIEEAETATEWNGRVNLITDFNALFRAGVDDVAVTPATALYDKEFLAYMSEQIQTWSERMKYLRSDLNIAGVTNTLPKGRQNLMMLGDIEAKLRVYLNTWAYNQGNLSLGAITNFDAWYSIGADATASPVVKPDDITIKGDLGLGGTDPCIGVMFDERMLQIWNKKSLSENARNARGHYTNYWRTVGDIYAASPFHNFVAFYLA